MKTLPLIFTRKGWQHRQLARHGNVAIYERSRPLRTPHFELVRVGSHKGYDVAGKHIDAAETYPSSEQLGSRAWTFNDRAVAEERFRQLT